MVSNRKGQFSTYLKPVLVVVFGMLMVLVVQQILGFQISVGEEEAGIQFVSQIRRNFNKVTDCLRHEGQGGGRYVLSRDKINQFSDYSMREPECAEDFKYGYYVNITTDCSLDTGVDECQEESFRFGEINGSTGKSLENSLTLSYPVLVRQNGNNVPADLELSMRGGEIEVLGGGFNRVLKKGSDQGVFNMTFSFSNEKYYCTKDRKLCTGRDTSNCVMLREEVPEMSFSPGSHILRFFYRDGSLQQVRGNTSSEGCQS